MLTLNALKEMSSSFVYKSLFVLLFENETKYKLNWQDI